MQKKNINFTVYKAEQKILLIKLNKTKKTGNNNNSNNNNFQHFDFYLKFHCILKIKYKEKKS